MMKKSAFVLMPFAEEFTAAYRMFIKDALEQAGFETTRADDLLNQRNIMQDVISGIAGAHLVVADLTGSNPNVFYELGISHALQKPTILLTQSIDDLPFDLRSYRVLVYQTHFAKIDQARSELLRLAENAFAGTALFGNPVTDFHAKQGTSPSQALAQANAESQTPAGDDRGFIDHMFDVEEGYGQIAQLIARVTAASAIITPKTTEFGERLVRARNEGGQLMSSKVRFLCQQYSADLDVFTTALKEINDEYEEIADRVQNSLEFIVRFQRRADADSAQVSSFLESIKGTRDSTSQAREAFTGARDSLLGMLGFEKSIKRSGSAAMQEFERLISNVSKTISSMDRALEAAGGDQ